jgi:hypothetical protein
MNYLPWIRSFPISLLKKDRLEAFFVWLEGIRPKVLPKSALGKAVNYALNHRKGLFATLPLAARNGCSVLYRMEHPAALRLQHRRNEQSQWLGAILSSEPIYLYIFPI